MTHLRISQALIICSQEEQLIGYNFLQQCGFECTDFVFTILDGVKAGMRLEQLQALLPEMDALDLKEGVETLLELGALVETDSPEDKIEQAKLGSWEWGLPSALFHYCDLNKEFLTVEEATEIQKAQLKNESAPELYTDNSRYDEIIPLSHKIEENALLSLISKRRTIRELERCPIPLEILSDCLYAGLGINGEVINDAGVVLPLSMTPSGGGRNPYEAYVYVRAIEGLKAGVYHYSAKEHSLGLIHSDLSILASELLKQQAWGDDMACVVFLCAHFERTMWKYKDNNAYRVVMIEAGHIGQNIMLAATQHGCTACPTAALAHDQIKTLFEIKEEMVSPVYALALGKV